jgi:hypothetical protein
MKYIDPQFPKVEKETIYSALYKDFNEGLSVHPIYLQSKYFHDLKNRFPENLWLVV